jgi:hypothetical protein
MTLLHTSGAELRIVQLLDEIDDLRDAHADAVAREKRPLADSYLAQIKNRAHEIDALISKQRVPPGAARAQRET